MTSRGPSSTAVSALIDRTAAAPASATASNTRAGVANGSEFQSLLAGGRNASAPAATDADKRKARAAADDSPDAQPASAAVAGAAMGPGITSGNGSALPATRTSDTSGASGSARAASEPAQSSSPTAAATSPGSSAPTGSGAPAQSGTAAGNPDASPSSTTVLSAESDPAALAGNLASSTTVSIASPGPAAALTQDGSTVPARRNSLTDAGRGSPDGSSPTPPIAGGDVAPGGAVSADPEQQLLAWLSGAAGLTSGPAGPTTAGSTGSGPAPGQTAGGPSVAGPTAVGPIAAAPAGAGSAGATAAELALAASGTLSEQGVAGSAATGGSSDAARTDPLSTDSSQGVSALLATSAAPLHLAASHAGSAQQATGTLQSPVGTSAWVEELGAQISWMANQGIDTASLHVSPAELGPIEVRIAVHGSDASVWFGAAQATTRSALEQALPQLRQLLASQGLTLADAGVFREPPRGSAQQAPARSLAPVAAVSEQAAHTAQTNSAARLGLLDLYA